MLEDPRRRTPRTDTVLADPRLVEATVRLGPGLVRTAVAGALTACREGEVDPDGVVDLAVSRLPAAATSLRAVVNASGVVVHTNLGRAPLSAAAVTATAVAAGATDVEL
ncbi:MAG: L-seryl-tRNA(Sec) selenium transferase, partial [Nocardioidaceae bacterium]